MSLRIKDQFPIIFYQKLLRINCYKVLIDEFFLFAYSFLIFGVIWYSAALNISRVISSVIVHELYIIVHGGPLWFLSTQHPFSLLIV